MNTFDIPVTYKGEDILFPATMVRYGYINRIVLLMNEKEIFLEQDEEGLYRAIIEGGQQLSMGDEDMIREIILVMDAVG